MQKGDHSLAWEQMELKYSSVSKGKLSSAAIKRGFTALDNSQNLHIIHRLSQSQSHFICSNLCPSSSFLFSFLPPHKQENIHSFALAADRCFYSMTCCFIKNLLQPQVLFKLIKSDMVLSASFFLIDLTCLNDPDKY